jgi:hypothetical protein
LVGVRGEGWEKKKGTRLPNPEESKLQGLFEEGGKLELGHLVHQLKGLVVGHGGVGFAGGIGVLGFRGPDAAMAQQRDEKRIGQRARHGTESPRW